MPDRVILRAAEEEELVLQDRAADIAAEAVVIETRILRSITWQCVACHNRVDGVQIAVLKVLVRQPVELVRSALQNVVELPAVRVAKFRRVLILQHCEFRDGIGWHWNERSRHTLAVVIDTFNREVIVARTLPANGRAGSRTERSCVRYTRRQQRKIKDSASAVGVGARQLQLLQFERGRNRWCGCVQSRRFAGDLNGGYRTLDFQRNVLRDCPVQVHLEIVNRRGPKIGRRGRKVISAYRQVREPVLPVVIRFRRVFYARCRAHCFDRRARHGPARLVENGPNNIATDGLSA